MNQTGPHRLTPLVHSLLSMALLSLLLGACSEPLDWDAVRDRSVAGDAEGGGAGPGDLDGSAGTMAVGQTTGNQGDARGGVPGNPDAADGGNSSEMVQPSGETMGGGETIPMGGGPQGGASDGPDDQGGVAQGGTSGGQDAQGGMAQGGMAQGGMAQGGGPKAERRRLAKNPAENKF